MTISMTMAMAGCHAVNPNRDRRDDASHGHADATAGQADAPAFHVYPLRGKVVATNPAKGEVTLDHEAIPGFMQAMTMPYQLKDPGILSELHPGDILVADLLVSQASDAESRLDHIVVVGQAQPDYKPAVLYHVPAPGDAVPDFALRNQDGRLIHLRQFRGKALLLTFIYTRCPLPDFCPRVTRNFAAIDRQLAQRSALYAKTHLLCASFDPATDTPARLKAYGEQYIGLGDGQAAENAMKHWDFAAPSKPVLGEMARYFDVGMTQSADTTFTHTLSTTLIGPDGKVVRFYPGNDWSTEQVLADIRQLFPGA